MDGKINSAAWFDYGPRVIGTLRLLADAATDCLHTFPRSLFLRPVSPSTPPSNRERRRKRNFVPVRRAGRTISYSRIRSEGSWRGRRRMLILGVLREARLRGALFSRGMLEISSERENLIARTPSVIESCVRSSAIRGGYVRCEGGKEVVEMRFLLFSLFFFF